MLQVLVILQDNCICCDNTITLAKGYSNACNFSNMWSPEELNTGSKVVYIVSTHRLLAKDKLKLIPICKGTRSTIFS